MNITRYVAACFLIIVAAEMLAAKEWRGIVPYRSTRADVERLLGEPPPPPVDGTRAYTLNRSRSIYFLDEGEIYIVYADESSPAAASCAAVPAGTVMMIQVTPKNDMRLGDLRLDEQRFRKFDPSEPQGIGYEAHIDEEEGLLVRTFEGKVDQINYVAAALDKHLCPSYSENPEAIARVMVCGLGLGSRIDEYGDISIGDEKARLDFFVMELQKNPAAKGYIIAYAGRRARTGEARRRAERAMNYLTDMRGVETRQIAVIDGGHREELSVELFMLPEDAPAPTAVPTVDPSEVRIIDDARKPRKRRGRTRR